MRRLPGVVAVLAFAAECVLEAQAPPARICTGHSPGLAIPDITPAGVNDDLAVYLNGHLADLDLELHVTHTHVGDLKVRLTHVNTGTNELLLDIPGGSIPSIACQGDDIDAILNDEGKDGVTIDHGAENECDNLPALHGHLVPGDPVFPALLGAFQGEKVAGTWRLNVSDNAGFDFGTLDEWCLLPFLQEPGPDACTWHTPAAFPSTVVRALAVYFPDNGDVYVLGGRTDDSSGTDILNPYEYNPATNAWTQKGATFADAAVDNMVGGVLEVFGARTIFMVGGSAAAAVTAVDTVRQYDPLTDSLSDVSSDPWPGVGANDTLPGGAAVVGNKLYVFGGYKINSNMTNTIWEFDPAKTAGNRWRQMNSVVPSAEGYIPTAVANGYVYLLGGANFISNVITETNNVYRYDPRTDHISTLALKPGRAIAETQAVTERDGSIWVFSGGRDANAGNPAAQVNIYHPGTDTWTVGPPISVGRRNAAVAADPEGRIWAVGGYQTINMFPTPVALHEALVCPLLVDGFERGSAVDWTGVVP